MARSFTESCGNFSTTASVLPPRKFFITSISSSSESFSMALRPLARMSLWARWEPKIKSSGFRWNAWPTAADSWPMDRCAGPGWL